jgi:hypothetical protein
MNRRRVIASAKAAAAILTVSLFQWPVQVAAATVTSEQAACDLTKARVAARGHFSVSAIAFCDVIVPEAQPKGFYVLALHSTRKCDGICSTHMGWFAVHKASGRVYEWDINEDKLGSLVTLRH